jgi:DNA-binding transcriptional LysR family regulator
VLTFKQLEALYWVVQLGGFSPAAQKLHTTQSAVSKRVQELEALFDIPLFDRSLRAARLTEKGEEMFMVAKRLLEQRDAAVEQFQRPEVVERRVRIGVTELTAMTWLPRFVNVIQHCYPRVVIEPDVDMSTSLRDKLLADEVELIIVPDAFDDSRFTSKRVGTVENAWMCKPGMVSANRPLRIHELAAYRLLTQGDRSGTGLLYERWFKSIGVRPSNTMTSNSLVALLGLAVSGFGIGYMPRKCLSPMMEAGLLEVVKVTPELPETPYAALYKSERRSTLLASLVMLAQDSCDFGSTFRTDAVE